MKYNNLEIKIYRCSIIFLILYYFSLLCAKQVYAEWASGGGFGVGGKAPRAYESCVFGYETNDLDNMLTTLPTTLTIRPVGAICYKACQDQCSKAFGITKATHLQNIVTINKDLIERCITTCQKGSAFTLSKAEGARVYQQPINENSTKVYDETKNIEIKAESLCAAPSLPDIAPTPEGSDYIFYNSRITVKPGDKINVYMTTPQAQDNILQDDEPNTIYLCGRKSIYLYPTFYSTKYEDWNTPAAQDICTATASITRKECSDPKHWHARNAQFTQTGIYAKDGDYLNIQYAGRYHWNIAGNKNLEDYVLEVLTQEPNYQDDTSITLMDPKYNIQNFIRIFPGNQLKASSGESPNTDASVEVKDMENNEKLPLFLGLKGKVVMIQEPQTFGVDYAINQNAYDSKNKKFRLHIFNGILDGYSKDKYAPLYLRHHDTNRSRNWYDNVGGYNVNITWKGCTYRNGERLQYAFIDSNTVKAGTHNLLLHSDTVWQNVPWHSSNSSMSNQPVLLDAPSNTSNDMALFFRIKLLTEDDLKNTELLQIWPDAYKSYNTSGRYTIGIKKLPQTECDPFIGKLIANEIYTPLFGSFQGSDGIVQQFFNIFIKDQIVLNMLRALLLLYVTYTGVSFILGTSKITQKEATVRLTKIAVVLMLMSQGSWDFFNKQVFVLFTDGMVELIDKLTYDVSDFTNNKCIANNNNYKTPRVLTDFYKVLSHLFNEVFWQKFIALVFSGIVGCAIGLMILAGTVLYFVCMIKATMIYIISLFGIALLLMLAPFFIPLILFNYTKSVFDGWLKQITVFALQPVFVFSSIWFFQRLLIMLLQVSLSFTMCKVCLIGLVLPPILNLCLINVYRPLMTSHSPSHFAIPVTNVSEAICFLLLAQAMFVFCGFASNLASRIVSYASVSASDIGAVSNFTSPITGGITSVMHGSATMLGIDSGSRKIRSDAAAKKAKTELEKVKKRDAI